MSQQGKRNFFKRAALSGMDLGDDFLEEDHQQQEEEGNQLQDIEEEHEKLLKIQEKFLSSNVLSSASVTKKSKFAQQQQLNKEQQNNKQEKQVIKESIFNNLTVVERNVTNKKKITPPSLSTQQQAFPSLKQPTLTHFARKKKNEQNFEENNFTTVKTTTTTTKTVTSNVGSFNDNNKTKKELEREDIEKESDKLLNQMTKEEIKEAQEQLMKNLDPNLINLLKNRGKEKQKKSSSSTNNNIINELTTTTTSTSTIIKKNEMPEIIEQIKKSLNPSELKNLKEEEEKLKWIIGDDNKEQLSIFEEEEDKKDKSEFKNLRFDFNGNIIVHNENINYPSYLYHHGKEPEKAGYNLNEIFHLLRSKVSNQRVLNFKLLINILKNFNRDKIISLINYLENKYNFMKCIFWFGLADPIHHYNTMNDYNNYEEEEEQGEDTNVIVTKNLNVVHAGIELFYNLLNIYYSKNNFEKTKIIDDNHFDYGNYVLNFKLKKEFDLLRKDIINNFISHLTSILEHEQIDEYSEMIVNCLILISKHSLSLAYKVNEQMFKKHLYNRLTFDFIQNHTNLSVKYIQLINIISKHGYNMCYQLFSKTNLNEICKKQISLLLNIKPDKFFIDQIQLGKELLTFLTICFNYKMSKVIQLYGEDLFNLLIPLIQYPFHILMKENIYIRELSKTCLFLIQSYMSAKSSLNPNSLANIHQDEIDENSIGHLENFILQDCPFLLQKTLDNQQYDLSQRLLYCMATFYDHFYCNPNSDFHRLLQHESYERNVQIFSVMKRVENKKLFENLKEWMKDTLQKLKTFNRKDILNWNNQNIFIPLTNYLGNLTSIVMFIYFCIKSFKHIFTLLFEELHFEEELNEIYQEIFVKFLFQKELFISSNNNSKQLQQQTTILENLFSKFYFIRQRIFLLSHHLLKITEYEKTNLKNKYLTHDQLCNLSLFTIGLLDPYQIRDDSNLFIYHLKHFILIYFPKCCEFIEKEMFQIKSSSILEDVDNDNNNDKVDSCNLQIGVPNFDPLIQKHERDEEEEETSKKNEKKNEEEEKDKIITNINDWIFIVIEYYYLNRLENMKDLGLLIENIKFIIGLTYGFKKSITIDKQFIKNQLVDNNYQYIHILFPKIIQLANMLKVFLLDDEIFLHSQVQQYLQYWIDMYYLQEYYLRVIKLERQEEGVKEEEKKEQKKDNLLPFGLGNTSSLMKDRFYQMFEQFVEHFISSSFNQVTFSQYILSFFIHTNYWDSKYRMKVLNEMITIKQITTLRMKDNSIKEEGEDGSVRLVKEWIERIKVFPIEKDLLILNVYVKRYLSQTTWVELEKYGLDTFILHYMIYHVTHLFSKDDKVMSDWSVEKRNLFTLIYEYVKDDVLFRNMIQIIRIRMGVEESEFLESVNRVFGKIFAGQLSDKLN